MTLTSSMNISPESGSATRNKAMPRLDLPAPVLPTIPTFSFGLTVKPKFFSTSGILGRYRSCGRKQTSEASILVESVKIFGLISQSYSTLTKTGVACSNFGRKEQNNAL